MKNLHIQPQQYFHIGDHRDTEPLGHQAGNHLVLFCFVRDLGYAADLGEESVHNVPHPRTNGEIEQRIEKRIGQIHSVQASQRMGSGYDQDQVLPAHRNNRQLELCRRLGAKYQIEAICK